MSDNDPTGIWQDFRDATDRANELQIWYTESESRHAACANAAQKLEDERNEARKANKAYTILLALDRDEIEAQARRIAELELNHVYMNERILAAEGKA